jgi:hypothetical protein
MKKFKEFDLLRTKFLLNTLLFGSMAVFGFLWPSFDARAEDASPVFNFGEFFSDSSSAPRSQPQRKSRKSTQAGTSEVGCKECSAMKQAADPLEAIGDIAKKTPKRTRAKQIVKPYQEPTYEGPNPDAQVWAGFPDVAGYSDSKEVATMIRMAKQRAGRASTGKCYKYVKDAIFNSQVKLTSKRLVATRVFPNRRKWRGDYGLGAVENFESEGFINLLTNPETKALLKNPAAAPKGAIMIYRGGNNGGHIEIKTDYGNRASYVSDYINSTSILGNELAGRTSAHYQLVGVMIKPMKKAE